MKIQSKVIENRLKIGKIAQLEPKVWRLTHGQEIAAAVQFFFRISARTLLVGWDPSIPRVGKPCIIAMLLFLRMRLLYIPRLCHFFFGMTVVPFLVCQHADILTLGNAKFDITHYDVQFQWFGFFLKALEYRTNLKGGRGWGFKVKNLFFQIFIYS